MLASLVATCAVLGLAVGSFANVVIYRVPRGESVVRPRSHCPSCAALINGRDNIPIVSWVVLRGRCRSCGVSISARYVVVEALTGALFALDAARLGYSAALPAVLAATATLVILSAIDVERLILPKRVVYPGLGVVAVLFVAAAAYDHSWSKLSVGAIGAAAWFALFFLINLASPRALGFGDVRLAPLLGLTLGWFGYRYAVIGFFAANLIGAVVGLALIGLGHATRREPIPYGVFLAIGAIGTVLCGQWLVSWTSGIR